ncbi:hypothetical protein AXF42_Ash008665 [Apostasia shenzhenica]|uniref:Glucosidase 2 subunit beta n=1 Tax=Apostasia shenzhenica TaxID=1088818 RepID=A0A2I0B209_9ASPA|nr:hypothetical protein AXF42_Ash008665 [Apostasia shenzhenica]
MENHAGFALLVASFCLIWVSGATSISNKQYLGIDPRDLSYYKSDVIKCINGSKKFTREQLNDEFCDCPDGTDEPGTSACPEGKFYCQNAGHIPLKIFSSRVNDGICDCCDGSDEYDGNANCPNTCWEAGKAARERLKKKIETFKEGIVARKKEIEKAKEAYTKDEAELAKLKSDEKMLKELVQKLKEQKERIEKLEQEERLKKEKEEKRLREEEEKSKEQEEKAEESQQHSTDSSHEQEILMDSHDREIESRNDDVTKTESAASDAVEQENVDSGAISDDAEGLSKEELGRLVASRWTGQEASEKKDIIGNVEEDQVSHDPDEHYGYNSETEENRAKYDEDDRANYDEDNFEDDQEDEYEDDNAVSDGSYIPDQYEKTGSADTTDTSNPSWFGKIQRTVQNVLHAFNFFKTPVNVSEAAHIRKEYEESNSKLSRVQSKVSSLSEKLKHDFGKEKEFYLFYDHCFESKQNKYVYKICPFKQASQVEGHSTTRLGSWDKFEESYRVMLFSNGDRCWNGPDRSLKVRLRCGVKNEVSDVDEPSRCEYLAFMSTPSVCLEDKLKELEQKLGQLTTMQPQNHDEL